MPFERPELDTIRSRIAADLVNKLPGADTRLRTNNLRAFSEVEAGTTHLLYGRLDWSFEQLFPDTAEKEFLDRWASIWGVARVPASAGTGPGRWPAQPGAAVPAGARIRRGDGFTYTAPLGAPEQGGFVDLQLRADLDGAAGNADPGTGLTLMTTATGVSVAGVVPDPGIAGGADEQADPLLLRRLLARIQAPPHGGADFDYVAWALEVPGVTRAWPYPRELGLGTVVVRFMMDDVRPPDGIPEGADVLAVAAHIDGVRPVTADVHVFAPIAAPTAVVIEDLAPDTPQIRQLIVASLRQMLLQEAEPGGAIFRDQWSAAISFTPGVRRFVLIAPAAAVTVPVTHIITLGQVTFQP